MLPPTPGEKPLCALGSCALEPGREDTGQTGRDGGHSRRAEGFGEGRRREQAGSRSPTTGNSTVRNSPLGGEKKERNQRIKEDFEQKGTFAGPGEHLSLHSTRGSFPPHPPAQRCSTFDRKRGAAVTCPHPRPHAVAPVTHKDKNEVVFQQHSYTRDRAVSPLGPPSPGLTLAPRPRLELRRGLSCEGLQAPPDGPLHTAEGHREAG